MFENLKPGQSVTVYAVVSYVNGVLKVEHAQYEVVGDENGEPLCVRLDKGRKEGHTLGEYGSQVKHLHEVAFTEAEAVRRWRAEKLVDAIKYENFAKSNREELRRTIRNPNDTRRYVPEEPQRLRVRVEE